MALLYWPAREFMNLVLTTSTGEATTVVQKPAPKAAVKWQGRLSEGEQKQNRILPQYLILCHLKFVAHLVTVQFLHYLSLGHTSG